MNRQFLNTGWKTLLVLSLVTAFLIPGRLMPASAAPPIEVTTTADEFGSGADCSLREAVQAVNTGASFGGCSNPGVIDIHLPANTYNLTGAASEWGNATGDINVLHDLTLTGDDFLTTIINGPSDDRILWIDNGNSVTIDKITFQNGHSPNQGGAIYNAGSLDLNYVSIHNNKASGYGGGIYTTYFGEPVSHLNLYYSQVYDNEAINAGGLGGGIANYGGYLNLSSSSINNNNSYSDGGGVWSMTGYLSEINYSLVHTNKSLHGSGGNIYNDGPMNVDKTRIYNGDADMDGGNIFTGWPGGGGSIMNITNSDISFGFASGNGGGIANDGWLTLANVSFKANSNATGAALYTMETVAKTSLDHVTMSGNIAGVAGAVDIYNAVPSNPVEVYNSILEAGTSTACIGAVAATSSYSIDSGSSCSLPGGQHNMSSTDPLLGLFDFHGGITKTFPLAVTSPAVDAAKDFGCVATDQRGLRRPIDGNLDGVNGCDIGAYELQLMAYLPLINK
jgi:CSLREA domain-containing protein